LPSKFHLLTQNIGSISPRLAWHKPRRIGRLARLMLAASALSAAGCTTQREPQFELQRLPETSQFCLEAQRVVTRTNIPMQLKVHDDFNAFVKSKALIEGPTIHQYNWYDASGNMLGISCKMKSADHLNVEFGQGSAGPDGYCHDMNRQVYQLLKKQTSDPKFNTVSFDPSESLDTKEQNNMIGPVWLKPFMLTYLDSNNDLHVATKGFVINYNDPRYQNFPPSWRGTHYCHLIAPDYFARMLNGDAAAGAIIGRAAEKLSLPAGAMD